MGFLRWMFLLPCIKLCLALQDYEATRLEQMEQKLADILDRLEQKEIRIKLLEDTVSALEEKVESQDKVIKALRVQKQLFVYDELAETQNNKAGRRKSTIKSNKNSFSSIQTKAGRLRRAENETPVAFFAALTNHTEHVGANQNIAFDKVFTNVGNAYNPHGGLFIAPVPGIYVFSSTLFAHPNTAAAHYHILKNGALITRMYHPDTYDTTSMTVVLELETDDDASVANADSDKTMFGYQYCSFSGFLLQQYYPTDADFIGK